MHHTLLAWWLILGCLFVYACLSFGGVLAGMLTLAGVAALVAFFGEHDSV